MTFGDIFRDLMHSFTNVERGPIAFMEALLLRPGEVAREYVEGKRRRHYGPFAVLAVMAGVTAVALNYSRFQPLLNDGLAPGTMALLQEHFNLLLLLQLPFVAVACLLVFGKTMTLPEHLVLVAYSLSVQAMVLTVQLAMAYLNATVVPDMQYVYGFWAAWYVYFGWVAAQFYRESRLAWVRGSMAAALGHIALIATLIGASALYERLA